MSSALLQEVHDLALTVAPELSAQPLYVMDSKELDGLPGLRDGDCLGWAAADLFFDREIADRLGERYRGAGNLFTLCLEAIEDAAKPGCYHRCVINTALHEVSHCLPYKEVFEPPDTTKVRVLQAERRERCWTNPPAEPGEKHDVHDHRFIRSAIHAGYRAAIAGAEFYWDGLLGNFGWMARPEIYLAALLPECVSMSAATFGEIHKTEPPKDFMELWAVDLAIAKSRRKS